MKMILLNVVQNAAIYLLKYFFRIVQYSLEIAIH